MVSLLLIEHIDRIPQLCYNLIQFGLINILGRFLSLQVAEEFIHSGEISCSIPDLKLLFLTLFLYFIQLYLERMSVHCVSTVAVDSGVKGRAEFGRALLVSKTSLEDRILWFGVNLHFAWILRSYAYTFYVYNFLETIRASSTCLRRRPHFFLFHHLSPKNFAR